MISSEPDFCCVVCERNVNTRWNHVGRDEELAPVCRWCEREHTAGVGSPAAGSFRDRRNTMRIYALADALHTAAMRITWSAEYAAA